VGTNKQGLSLVLLFFWRNWRDKAPAGILLSKKRRNTELARARACILVRLAWVATTQAIELLVCYCGSSRTTSTTCFSLNGCLSELKNSVVQALFSSLKNQKLFKDSPSHQILWHMYRALNIDEKQKVIAQFVCKSWDESFKSSYFIIRQYLSNKNENATL